MENSRTIGDALECANRFLFLLSPALSQDVIPDPLDNPAVVGIRHSNNLGITQQFNRPALSQIAVRVGVREQPSLTHAAQRWFGMSPSRLRQEAADFG